MNLLIKIKLADRVETALYDFDERVDRDSPEFLVYQAIQDRPTDGKGRIALTTADEVRVIYSELIGGIEICDEVLGMHCEGEEEHREYTMERGTLQRSADRLARFMTDNDIVFKDAERDDHG